MSRWRPSKTVETSTLEMGLSASESQAPDRSSLGCLECWSLPGMWTTLKPAQTSLDYWHFLVLWQYYFVLIYSFSNRLFFLWFPSHCPTLAFEAALEREDMILESYTCGKFCFSKIIYLGPLTSLNSYFLPFLSSLFTDIVRMCNLFNVLAIISNRQFIFFYCSIIDSLSSTTAVAKWLIVGVNIIVCTTSLDFSLVEPICSPIGLSINQWCTVGMISSHKVKGVMHKHLHFTLYLIVSLKMLLQIYWSIIFARVYFLKFLLK